MAEKAYGPRPCYTQHSAAVVNSVDTRREDEARDVAGPPAAVLSIPVEWSGPPIGHPTFLEHFRRWWLRTRRDCEIGGRGRW
jgi:hypothetical protein